MPGINRREVCRRIKANQATSPIPVVMFTVYGSEEDVIMSRKCGADAHITKPFDMEELLEIIDRLFSKIV